ncbi:MAG: hypothetical protein AVDCRST_MAG48-3643, partial [uncultured Friedmanniella sp.]
AFPLRRLAPGAHRPRHGRQCPVVPARPRSPGAPPVQRGGRRLSARPAARAEQLLRARALPARRPDLGCVRLPAHRPGPHGLHGGRRGGARRLDHPPRRARRPALAGARPGPRALRVLRGPRRHPVRALAL